MREWEGSSLKLEQGANTGLGWWGGRGQSLQEIKGQLPDGLLGEWILIVVKGLELEGSATITNGRNRDGGDEPRRVLGQSHWADDGGQPSKGSSSSSRSRNKT